jgi:hypothetical protein
MQSMTCTASSVPDSARVLRPHPAAATSPTMSGQSLPEDDPEEDSGAEHDHDPEENSGADSPGSSVPSLDAAPHVARVQTRLRKGIKHPKIYKDGTVRYGFLVSTDEPSSLSKALGDPQ